jgi:cell division protein FtsA
MTDIAEYVWNEIREAGFAKKLHGGIVLTGGTANLPRVAELFQRISGVETRVACAELGITSESFEVVASPALTLSVSLLLRGATEGATPVGFLQSTTQPVAEVVPPAKQEAAEPKQAEEQKPLTINDRYKADEDKTADEAADNDDKQRDDVDDEPVVVRKGIFGRLADRLKTSFDKAFQNPDDDEDDDNDEY